MKKYALTMSVFLLATPEIFLAGRGTGTTAQIIFICLVVLWGSLELWISLSMPFKGVAPSDARIKVCRMLWLVCAAYAWVDYQKDHRDSSNDSRFWGFFPAANIKGKAAIIYWPGTERIIGPDGIESERSYNRTWCW